MRNDKEGLIVLTIVSVIVLISLSSVFVIGQPTGVATITNMSHLTKNASAPDSRTDGKGTINTANLDAIQQDMKWKAYVGNVSSTFVLDDDADYTIYQWTLSSFDGEVYASRNSSISWGSIAVASVTHKENEDYALNHSSSAADSINQTFVTQTHRQFDVGTTSIDASTGYAIATNLNDTAQALTVNSVFQEVLLYDGASLVYASLVENNHLGYRNDSSTTYDFQMIMAENATASAINIPYFFYLELQ
ncbi:hypothetical protein HOD20_01350 [archaeon]|jgi:hypothetical protein|nr:hypothetical protein [archaeon]MBT4351150.1 hypothetical protein [archaeon]MBT4648267.1 hypothetical protein [archaeon]MBT6821519.1 hypothetical protein [archaeon]MBT7391918.1 hypothetical protein [archaeon]